MGERLYPIDSEKEALTPKELAEIQKENLRLKQERNPKHTKISSTGREIGLDYYFYIVEVKNRPEPFWDLESVF